MSDLEQALSQSAFPVAFRVPYDHHVALGMTLRDYFAAKALQGLCANPEYGGNNEFRANAAYSMADAMMKAREAKEAPPAPSPQAQEE